MTGPAMVTGTQAIALAKSNGAELRKYADPTEGARVVTLEEAEEIAKEDASLVYAVADAVTAYDGEGTDLGMHSSTDMVERVEVRGIGSVDLFAAMPRTAVLELLRRCGLDPSADDCAWEHTGTRLAVDSDADAGEQHAALKTLRIRAERP